jgi:hypothetical protein
MAVGREGPRQAMEMTSTPRFLAYLLCVLRAACCVLRVAVHYDRLP